MRRIVATTMTMASVGCAHAPQAEPQIYVISEDAGGIGGSGGRDCDAEHIECFDRCWNTAPPLTSIKKGSGKHHEYCTEKCREEYMECVKEQEQVEHETKGKELRFTNTDTALAWLRRHRSEVAVGTVVVIAGAAFVIATGGSGALILAPLAL